MDLLIKILMIPVVVIMFLHRLLHKSLYVVKLLLGLFVIAFVYWAFFSSIYEVFFK